LFFHAKRLMPFAEDRYMPADFLRPIENKKNPRAFDYSKRWNVWYGAFYHAMHTHILPHSALDVQTQMSA